jgi:hypothetical protein
VNEAKKCVGMDLQTMKEEGQRERREKLVSEKQRKRRERKAKEKRTQQSNLNIMYGRSVGD